MAFTHQIISMTAGKTSGSGSPMWRCKTLDGQAVNIFRHPDPTRSTFELFERAGYGAEMAALALDEALLWETSPVGVTMVKSYDGKWWNIVEVEPRPAGAVPDEQFVPDLHVVRHYVKEWAATLTNGLDIVLFWDTETTGTDKDAEIVSIAAINQFGEIVLSTLIRPERPEKLALNGSGAVNGFTAEMLADAPTFKAAYVRLYTALAGVPWVIFNAGFDAALLERQCIKHGLIPPPSLGVTCAMEMYARYFGEWDKARQRFTSKGLQFAVEQLGLEPDGAHTALCDARTTLRMIEAIAALEVQP